MKKNRTYKIYLDDERFPKTDGWLIVRSYDDFVSLVELLGIENCSEMSFDNDIQTEKEGKDCVKWLINEKQYDVRHIKFNVHSANTGGPIEYMYGLINNWNKFLNNNEQDNKNA